MMFSHYNIYCPLAGATGRAGVCLELLEMIGEASRNKSTFYACLSVS